MCVESPWALILPNIASLFCTRPQSRRHHGGLFQREDHDHGRVRDCLFAPGDLLLRQVRRLRSDLMLLGLLEER